jgi:hypothetical protein
MTDKKRAWGRAGSRKPKHPYLLLGGEALDNHMMVLHGWTMKMVDQKGTLTRAQDSHYIGNWHHSHHGCPPRTEHLEPDE